MREMAPNINNRFNIRNKTETPIAMQDAVTKYLSSSHEQEYAVAKENSISIKKTLGLNGLENLSKTTSFLISELNERGVTNPSFGQIFFQKGKAIETGKTGLHRPTHVEIFDRAIDNTNLKQMAILKVVSHELYHSTGKFSVGVEQKKGLDGTIGINTNMDAAGAGYLNAVGVSALEEGAAMRFETKIFEKIKKLFPVDSVSEYNTIINRGVETFAHKGKEVNEECISILEKKAGEAAIFSESNYTGSYNLVKYLEFEVADFNLKLEKLRVDRYSLDLARAIEGRFGDGAFRVLTTCKPADAGSLLAKFKSNIL